MNIAQSGESIAVIYSNHHGWLMRWLRAKLQCADHAADLAQDTFLRLLTAPQDGRQPLHEPRAYLATVAQCLLIDHCRAVSERSIKRYMVQAFERCILLIL